MHDADGVNVPEDDGLSEKVTSPPGATEVPGLVSETVTVQDTAWLTFVVAGLHETTVDVVLGVAVGLDMAELVKWIESPP